MDGGECGWSFCLIVGSLAAGVSVCFSVWYHRWWFGVFSFW